jgi:hypothetical protein
MALKNLTKGQNIRRPSGTGKPHAVIAAQMESNDQKIEFIRMMMPESS